MEKRIFYHDTDAGGVVYYGRYLNYLEEARTEFLDNRGLSVVEFTNQGYLYAVRKCNITYRSPARYGETINCTAELKKVTAAQLIFDQKITEKGTNRLMVEAEVTLVCLTSDFKPAQIPDNLKEKLA
ncbi:MAG: YbgC/FadM family acyl-CoA thioesterase [Candidatus Aceula meridiana]|nr:YbgC/FadM family acyl-CoA thioesterase [Candidatus Aceula meridiana]